MEVGVGVEKKPRGLKGRPRPSAQGLPCCANYHRGPQPRGEQRVYVAHHSEECQAGANVDHGWDDVKFPSLQRTGGGKKKRIAIGVGKGQVKSGERTPRPWPTLKSD